MKPVRHNLVAWCCRGLVHQSSKKVQNKQLASLDERLFALAKSIKVKDLIHTGEGEWFGCVIRTFLSCKRYAVSTKAELRDDQQGTICINNTDSHKYTHPHTVWEDSQSQWTTKLASSNLLFLLGIMKFSLEKSIWRIQIWGLPVWQKNTSVLREGVSTCNFSIYFNWSSFIVHLTQNSNLNLSYCLLLQVHKLPCIFHTTSNAFSISCLVVMNVCK